jgi:pSer/pThr/pTyr-binding forkhead associated (FHA) protein
MALLIQLTNSGTGIKLPIDKKQIEFGRDEDCDVSLDDELVSQRHAILEVVLTPDDNRVDYILQDKKSTNHTYVNDQRVDHRYLKNGDVIRIGKSSFRFEDKAKGDFSETLVLHETWFPGVFYTRSGKKKRKNKSVAQ